MPASRTLMGAFLGLLIALPLSAQVPDAQSPVAQGDGQGSPSEFQVTQPVPPASDRTDPVPGPEAGRYEAMVAASLRGERVDGAALRAAYTASPAYDPFFGSPLAMAALRGAMERDDPQAVLREAEILLGQAYVNARAHSAASAAHGKLGNAQAAARHLELATDLTRALVDGAVETGTETGGRRAFVVIGLAEGEFLMEALGLQAIAATPILDVPGKVYQRVAVRTADGRTGSMLLDVTYPAERARRAGLLDPPTAPAPVQPVP